MADTGGLLDGLRCVCCTHQRQPHHQLLLAIVHCVQARPRLLLTSQQTYPRRMPLQQPLQPQRPRSP